MRQRVASTILADGPAIYKLSRNCARGFGGRFHLGGRRQQLRATKPKSRHPTGRDEPSAAGPPQAPGLGVVALMLFVSGSSALVFQVSWMRELRLVFGATTAAVAAVLAIFMGGLGIGSAVLGRCADRSANPLRMYGQLETAVALTVAASPYLVELAAALYFRLGGQESLGIGGATLARLALAVAVLGLPTFLMGGTMPAAARSMTATGDVRRRALALLYGVNTLGAVCGAYFATFFALEFLGTRATLWFGCAMNLLVGMTAVSLARRMPALEVRTTPDGEVAAESAPRWRSAPLWDCGRAGVHVFYAGAGLVPHARADPRRHDLYIWPDPLRGAFGDRPRRRGVSPDIPLGAAKLVPVVDHLRGRGNIGGVAAGAG